MKTRVSVIIPAYNAERFIEATLETVFAQTRPADEVIVINDGSTDETSKFLKKYSGRILLIETENRGVSVARNLGTERAQGEFLQYLDADDLLRPPAIETRVDALEVSHADAAYSDWQKLNEESNGAFAPGDVICRRLEDVDADPQVALLTDFWAPPAAWMYRRSIVEKIGGWNPALSVIQDARFALDAAMHGARFVHVPGIHADHRVHRSHPSLSRRDALRFVQDVFESAKDVESRWRERGELTGPRQRALARVYDYTARSIFRKDYRLFRDNLTSLYGVDPGFALRWPKVAGALAKVVGPSSAGWILDHLPRPR